MSKSELLPFLNLGTLIRVLIIAAVAFAYFLRKRSNRHPMDNASDRNVAADLDASVAPDAGPRTEARSEP